MNKAREIGIESFWYKEASKETILEVMDRTMAGESVYPDSESLVRHDEKDRMQEQNGTCD